MIKPVFFSIIVPVYNIATWLPSCIQSVLTQTMKDFELLLVDDGSTDSSGQMCDQYAAGDSRVRVVHKSNGGLSSARNAGIDLALGKYLLFLDGDDYYRDENCLQILWAAVQANEYDIICFGYARTNESGAKTTPAIVWNPKNGKEAEDVLCMVRQNAYQSSACIKLICRTFLIKNAFRFEEGVRSEDVEFSGRLLLFAERMLFLPQSLYIYRIRENSITNTVGTTHFADLLRILERMVSVNTISPDKAQAYWGYLAFQYCTTLINWRLCGSPKKKGEMRRLKTLSALLKHDTNRIVRLVHSIYRLFGLLITSRLLQWYFRLAQLRRR